MKIIVKTHFNGFAQSSRVGVSLDKDVLYPIATVHLFFIPCQSYEHYKK